MEQDEKLCDEVETVGEYTHPGDRVSAVGGCEAAVTVRTVVQRMLISEYATSSLQTLSSTFLEQAIFFIQVTTTVIP